MADPDSKQQTFDINDVKTSNLTKRDTTHTGQDIMTLIRQRYYAARSGNNSACKYNQYQDFFLMRSGYQAQSKQTTVKTKDIDSQLKVNLYKVAVAHVLSLMNDNELAPLVYAQNPVCELDAKIYESAIKHELRMNKFDNIKHKQQLNGFFYGTGVYKLAVKKCKQRIQVKSIDPRNIVISNTSYYIGEDGQDGIEYIIEISRYTKEQIYMEWGVDVSDQAEQQMSADINNITLYNTAELELEKRMTNVYEAWINEKDKVKYPHGRTVIMTEWTLIDDRPCEWECGNPYVFIPCEELPDRIFGLPFIEYLLPVVTELNTAWMHMSENIALTGNPQKILNGNAFQPSLITNEAGKVYINKSNLPYNQVFGYLPPPPMNQWQIFFVNQLLMFFRMISGVQDVTQGQGEINSGTPAGISIEKMSENAETPLRQMIRNQKNGLNQLAEKLIAVIHQIKSESDLIRISGEEAQDVEAVLNRQLDMVKAITAKAGARTPDEIHAGVKTYFEHDKGLTYHKTPDHTYIGYTGNRLGNPTEFDVEVKSGSDIPNSKLDMARFGTQLFMSGKLDPKTWFEMIELPNSEKVLKRMGIWQQFMQWQEAVAQQQQMQAKARQQAEQDAMRDQVKAQVVQGQQKAPAGPPQNISPPIPGQGGQNATPQMAGNPGNPPGGPMGQPMPSGQ